MKASFGKPANRFVFTAIVLVLAMLAAPGRADSRVDLKQPADGETTIYAALLKDLQANLQRWLPVADIFRREGLLSYGLVDLNDDGVDEVLVHASTTFFCGNNPICPASVYMRNNDAWRFIGNVSVLESSYLFERYIFVEDNFHQGWRTLNDGEYRYCWVKKSRVPAGVSDDDDFLMPHVPGNPGYFWSVYMNEECPVK
ncbi:MAG: hypothetical protein JKY68_00700 [Rhodospirillales bacterium]|nr:hypothetical protein [Rhodospirillales bacterium]